MSSIGFLTGCLVCTTGGSSSDERLVQRLTLKHGGTFSRTFDPKRVTHLIVQKVGSKKHEMSIKQKIWALTVAWLTDSDEYSARQDEEKYRVGAFKGLNISVTQLNLDERGEVERLVNAGGGVFSSDLRQETCTHLIAQTPSGEKYNAARSWGGIWLVTPEWIHDCAAKEAWCSEKSYPVLAEIKLRSSRSENGTNKVDPTGNAMLTSRIGDTDTGDTLVDSEMLPAPEPVKEVLIGTGEEQDYALVTAAIPFAPLDSCTSVEINQAQYQSFMAAHYGQANCAGETFFNKNSLSGEVLFISGFSSQVEVLLRQLVILGGGTRHQMLSDHISTALLGRHASDRLKRSVLSHPMKPLPLTLNWLLSVTVRGWSEPSVHEINKRIELNRALEKQCKAQSEIALPNSFTNYTLLLPSLDVEKGNEDDDDDDDGEHGDEYADTNNHMSRTSPRPVVMTWKQRESHNSKLTAKLVAQKRRGDSNDDDRMENSVVDCNADVDTAGLGSVQNTNGNEKDNMTTSQIEIPNTSSARKKRKKGVNFKKTTSPPGSQLERSDISFTRRRSLRLNVDECLNTSSMPPGESQVAVLESLGTDSCGDDDW